MAGADRAGAPGGGAGAAAGAGGAAGSLRFAGYAALFDRVDRGGDVVRRGAFQAAVARGAAVPILWQHRPSQPIGRVEHLAEDARGLRVIGRVSGATAAGREAIALVRERAVDGLSFGFRAVAREGTYRELTKLELVEVSLVTFPMQPGARVHAVEDGE